ncbi:MAG: type II toxin-antitoxin system death-on-curing family toxin [Treponema sp.]|nr:type II toxin-antitoxin system death-on-curing family toxin [Treponema sp.]
MNNRPIVRLTTEIIIFFHEELINKIGGSHGIRDENLLDMSVNSPFQTFDGNDLYPTLIGKASHLAYSLIKNHPFIDGNKRIGVTAMIAFLKSNDINFICTNEELIKLGFGLADGSFDAIYTQEWIKNHITI